MPTAFMIKEPRRGDLVITQGVSPVKKSRPDGT